MSKTSILEVTGAVDPANNIAADAASGIVTPTVNALTRYVIAGNDPLPGPELDTVSG